MRYGFLLLLTGCAILGDKKTDPRLYHCPYPMREIPLSSQHWNVEYSGFGKIEFDHKTNEILIAPQEARTPQSTHASLVLSKQILTNYFDLIVEYKNNEPLRKTMPNPWEVFWLFFQYQKVGGQKRTNYAVAKPNGMELGKAFDEVGQTFLKTTDYPKTSFNQWHQLRIKRMGPQLILYFDNKKIFAWQASPDQDRLYDHHGPIGLYSEDASVTIRKLCLQSSK